MRVAKEYKSSVLISGESSALKIKSKAVDFDSHSLSELILCLALCETLLRLM